MTLVQDRADLAPVVVTHHGHVQTETRIDAEMKLPVLPAHLLTLNHEAWPLGLRHRDRGRCLPQIPHGCFIEIHGRAGNRDDASIHELDDFAPVGVYDYGQPFNRSGIPVLGFRCVGAEDLEEAAALFLSEAVIAGRTRQADYAIEIADTPFSDGCLPARMRLHRLQRGSPLFPEKGRLDAPHLLPRSDFTAGKIDHRFEGLGPILHDGESLPPDDIARPPL